MPEISWDGMPVCAKGCDCPLLTLGKVQLDWLLEKAFAAGRESAYTTDETEWSCRIKDGRPAFATSFTEAGAHRYAATDPVHLAVFSRRVGPWQRVPEAGGTDELQA